MPKLQKMEELTKTEQSVLFAHFVNGEFGLECINRNGQSVDFPENWNENALGVYKFNYKMVKNDKAANKEAETVVVQFRFVDNQQK
jgi:hypothetical protein